MTLLVNIDVPDLEVGIRFYIAAFGLVVSRRIGAGVAELAGFASPIYLLEKPEGSRAAAGAARTYDRHWTPVHLDIVVTDIGAATDRAVAAGAIVERPLAPDIWGSIVGLADPFGHGLCLLEFHNRGYDEIAAPPA